MTKASVRRTQSIKNDCLQENVAENKSRYKIKQ